VARDWNNLGLLRHPQRRYKEAISAFGSALEVYEELPPTGTARALVLGHFARSLDEDGAEASDTLPLFHRAIDELRSSAPSSPELAGVPTNMTIPLSRAQRATDAFRAAKEAYEVDLKVYGRDHPELIPDLVNLAGTASLLGRFVPAAAWLRKADNLVIARKGPGDLDRARTLSSLAETDLMLGRRQEALVKLSNANRIATRHLPLEDPLRSRIEHLLAELA
jgi:tetratricopeptide (TPR) repeat protein